MEVDSVLVAVPDGAAGEVLQRVGTKIEAIGQSDVLDLLVVFTEVPRRQSQAMKVVNTE